MGNFLQVFNAGNIASLNYKEIGTNDELGLIYNSNGSDYQIVSIETDSKYTIVGDTVDKISERTGYDKEDIMAILFIVYNAYDNYKEYLDSIVKNSKRYSGDPEDIEYNKREEKSLRKLQENLVETTAMLITKYNYQDVLGYLSEMPDYAIVRLFDGQQASEEFAQLSEDLSAEVNKSYDGEPEELVSLHFYN